ncbi:hypothetical protein [Tenacibaculum todarodis]
MLVSSLTISAGQLD